MRDWYALAGKVATAGRVVLDLIGPLYRGRSRDAVWRSEMQQVVLQS
ncbi:hypothetical protein [Burkholderia cenocepacia]|nr:hypothetical protein [Burkholderia cenocepacia]